MSQLTLKCEKFGLSRGLHNLLTNEDLVDVTLACQGQFIQAHKTVLAACSPHFRAIFKINPWQHPIVFMHNLEVTQLQALVDFMYNGEVTVNQENLPGFLKLADELRVSGLATQEKENQTKLPDDDAHSQMSHTSQRSASPPPAKIARRSSDVDVAKLDPSPPLSTPQQEEQHSGIAEQSWGTQLQTNSDLLLPDDIKIEDVQEEEICNLSAEEQEAISIQECSTEVGETAEDGDSHLDTQTSQADETWYDAGPSTSNQASNEPSASNEPPQQTSTEQQSQPEQLSTIDTGGENETNDITVTEDKAHEPSSTPSVKTPFRCKLCKDKFSSSSELQAHVETSHKENKELSEDSQNKRKQSPKTRYTCRMCPKDFSHQSVRIRHELEVHKVNINNPGKVFQCTLCPRVFSSKTLLSNHTNSHMKIM